MEAALPGGEMIPQQSKKYIELEFLNVTNPVQRKDAAHRKRVRKHVMKQSWQARKSNARSITLPGHHQVHFYDTSSACLNHELGCIDNNGTRKRCPNCPGCFPARHAEYCPRRLEVSNAGGMAMVTHAGDRCGADEFLELRDRRRLGAGDRDPFSSFPISNDQDNGVVEMLLRHCK
jgi:hypothetical protein